MVFAPLSLLWIDGYSNITRRTDDSLYADLNLQRLVRSLSLHPEYENFVRSLLLTFTSDTATIRYRQAVLGDFLHHPELVGQFKEILDEIITLENYLTTPQWKDNLLRQVAWRLSELERYVETVEKLKLILEQHSTTLTSPALIKLSQTVQTIAQSADFLRLKTELPELIPQIRNVRSITIGINLDSEMRPLSATLLHTHPELFEGESLLARLFGFKRDNEHPNPMHNARFVAGLPEERVELRNRDSPFMPPLFRDLSELMDDTSRPIANILKKYTQISSQFLIALKQEIAFYLGAVRMIKQVESAGLAMAQPTVLEQSERRTELTGLYNLNLCLQYLNNQGSVDDIISNDAVFNESGRIFILTGPNQGGKTTYTQAVALAQILFQVGLPVPASQATLSPVDAIYTHFSSEEKPNLEAGRLGEEARRLNEIFQQATRSSFVLLNESLASTAASEALYLAQDVVKALRLLGVRAIFATHLHELAASADELNSEVQGDSAVMSMVSQIADDGVRRTYRIIPSPPMSKSYAIELAARYGISFEQLSALLQKRAVL